LVRVGTVGRERSVVAEVEVEVRLRRRKGCGERRAKRGAGSFIVGALIFCFVCFGVCVEFVWLWC
jgi:hypothetical protein